MKETAAGDSSSSCCSFSPPLCLGSLWVYHTTKSDMTGAGVDHLRMPRRRTVAPAVVGRAEIGAAFDNLARDTDAGLRRVVAQGLQTALRIARHAARALGLRRMVIGIPVSGPFPDIADHIVEMETVGRERSDRRAADKPVQTLVAVRERALPGVRHVVVIGDELVSPGKHHAVQSAAGGKFPFRLGGQLLARPRRVGLDI